MKHLLAVCFIGIFSCLTVAEAQPCEIGERRGAVDSYRPNPSEHLDLVRTIEENRSCFSDRKNICETGEVHHPSDGYAGDHIAYFIVLNSKLVFLATTPYQDGTYGSDWGSLNAKGDFEGALSRIRTATACELQPTSQELK